jgi:hypothetical protein
LKRNSVWKSFEQKLKESIKFKDLIKLLMGFMDLITDSIEENQVWRPNLDQLTKIERLRTQFKLGKAKLVPTGVQLREI